MGRPRGWVLNRRALEHQLTVRCITRTDLASAAGISAQMLGDLGSRTKRTGASPQKAAAIAAVLECPVEMLFPEAAGFSAPEYAGIAA